MLPRTLVIMALCVGLAMPAQAQNAASVFKSRLIEMNELDPQQNQSLEQPETFLGYEIQDDTNRAIGTVEDLLINETGRVETIVAAFDTLELRGQKMFLENVPATIALRSSAYKVPYHREQLAARMPEMLSNIQTAAGEESITSVSALAGRQIVTGENNTKVAEVMYPMLDQNARRVAALLITDISGAGRSEPVAIPYSAEIEVDNDGFNNYLRVSEEIATAIQSFARSQ